MTLNSYVKEINTHPNPHTHTHTHTHTHIYIYIYIRYLQNIPGITLFLRNTKQYNHATFLLQNSPLCKYPLLRATVNMLETFLEAILLKPFQFVRHSLNHVSSFTKAPSLPSMLLFNGENK